MSKPFLIIPLALFSLIFSCTVDQEREISQPSFDAEVFIEELRLSDCPDKRVCVFDVSKGDNGTWSGTLSDEETMKSLQEMFDKQGIKHTIQLLPGKELEQPFGLISVSTAQLRGKPKHSSELVSQGLLGQPIKILKRQDDWFYVQLVDGYLGWMESLSFTPISTQGLAEWTNSDRAFMLNKNRDVYDESGQVITELVAANIISILGESKSNTIQIRLPDGQEGFVKDAKYMKTSYWENMEIDTESLLDLAKDYMGIPYVWGGATIKGFDCSGYTKTLFLLHGIELPRDASQQVRCGEEVNTDENFDQLQKGDLLFFGRKATEEQKEKVTHVAVYLGDLDFIHASGEVRIQSLDPNSERFASNRLETYLRAKRVTEDCIGNYQHQL